MQDNNSSNNPSHSEKMSQQIEKFSDQLEKLENDIGIRDDIRTFISPHISNELLEDYKKRANELETTLQQLKIARYEIHNEPEMETAVDDCLKFFDKRLKK